MNLVWFKRDLRLLDHAPLQVAIERGEPLLMIYILEPELEQNAHYTDRHWRFIFQSITDVNKQLEGWGGEIHILEGNALSIISTLHQSTNLRYLFSYEETGIKITFERDLEIAKFCAQQGVIWLPYSYC